MMTRYTEWIYNCDHHQINVVSGHMVAQYASVGGETADD